MLPHPETVRRHSPVPMVLVPVMVTLPPLGTIAQLAPARYPGSQHPQHQAPKQKTWDVDVFFHQRCLFVPVLAPHHPVALIDIAKRTSQVCHVLCHQWSSTGLAIKLHNKQQVLLGIGGKTLVRYIDIAEG